MRLLVLRLARMVLALAMSLWSWCLDAGGLTSTYIVGKKRWWGWVVWQGVNALWVVYAFTTSQWGFLPGCAIYAVLNWRNMVSWRRGETKQDCCEVHSKQQIEAIKRRQE